MRIQAAHVRPLLLAIFLIASRLSFSKDMWTVLVCPTLAVFVFGCVVISILYFVLLVLLIDCCKGTAPNKLRARQAKGCCSCVNFGEFILFEGKPELLFVCCALVWHGFMITWVCPTVKLFLSFFVVICTKQLCVPYDTRSSKNGAACAAVTRPR